MQTHLGKERVWVLLRRYEGCIVTLTLKLHWNSEREQQHAASPITMTQLSLLTRTQNNHYFKL